MSWLAEAHLDAGKADVAQQTAMAALDLATAIGELCYRAHAERVLGEIAARRALPEVEEAKAR